MKGRLEEAFRSGSLDDAVRKAIEGEVAPEAEAEPEAAEAPMDDIVKLQIQLRAVMLDAVESLGILKFQETEAAFVYLGGAYLQCKVLANLSLKVV